MLSPVSAGVRLSAASSPFCHHQWNFFFFSVKTTGCVGSGWRYSTGGSVDPEAAYVAFRGREPEPDALLRRRGLLQTAEAA